MPAEQVARVWEQRDYESKIRDLYYDSYLPQSTVLPTESVILETYRNLKKKFPETSDMPFPQAVAGIKLVPDRIEWWGGWHVGQPDWGRYLYVLEDGTWSRKALVF